MKAVSHNRSGFTIVELLIVIVVIAILAAISIVAYNGIQARAETAKSVSAVASWAKAIRMYSIDTDSWPTNSCLGKIDTYSISYEGRCWAPDTSTWEVRQSFLTQMEPYIGSTYPEPSIKNITDVEATQYRGAMFLNVSSTDNRIYAMLPKVSVCPSISGLGEAYSFASYTNGKRCMYRFAQ